ncbi:MAG: hypothetical protein AAGF92_01675 [Myxococcota bacterium]
MTVRLPIVCWTPGGDSDALRPAALDLMIRLSLFSGLAAPLEVPVTLVGRPPRERVQ